MKGYITDAPWDDPFERRDERRACPRFDFRMRITLTADDPQRHGRVIGPAIIRNVSQSGLLIRTKHVLSPLQRVSLLFSTTGYSDGICLPERFEGTAVVFRTRPLEGARHEVALRFGDDLAQNMEFVVFIDLVIAQARNMPGNRVA